MPLVSMPNEILLSITRSLRNHDIESLAQTFNSKITPICLSLLGEWLLTTRNERKMIGLFSAPAPYDAGGSFEIIFEFRPEELGEYSAPSEEAVERLRPLDYLELKGDFRWLQRFHPKSPGDINVKKLDKPAVTFEEMASFKKTCLQLGLTVPQEFAHFMANMDLQTYYEPGPLKTNLKLVRLKKFAASKTTSSEKNVVPTVDGYACTCLSWLHSPA
jgi:hypothetical protein